MATLHNKIDIQFKPLTDAPWPGERTRERDRRRAPFRKLYGTTLIDLCGELRSIGAKAVVIRVEADPSDIRLDGLPRSDARIRNPAVMVQFEGIHGPMTLATDVFDSWQDNLRAIALALHDLRRLDRYGIGRSGEQYRGFAALPASAGEGFTSKEEAARFINLMRPDGALAWDVGAMIRDPDTRASAYRAAARVCHPDAAGGSHELMTRLNRAKEMLSKQDFGGHSA